VIQALLSLSKNARGAGCFCLAALLLAGVGCDDKALDQIDRTPPELTITSPADADTVSGVSFPVLVDVADEGGVDRVECRVEQGSAATADVSPYSNLVINLPYAAGTMLTVDVEAFDVAGNSTTASIDVFVASRTLTRLTSNPSSDRNPAWTPDGEAIAFQADRDGSHYDIWIMNADGSGQTRMTANVNEDENPVWSADGAQIAFDSDRNGNYDLWVMSAATGEAGAYALTVANNDDREPAYAPDGASIFFTSDRGLSGVFNVWRAAASGDAASQITAYLVDDISPAPSPMGEFLAFVSPLNFTTNHVYLLAQETGAVSVLTGDNGITETEPAWSPLDRAVLFSRSAGTHSNLWLMKLGEAVPVQVTFGTGTVGDGGAAWSPDGSRIAFHSDRSGNLDIYVIQ
jgi:Tol biopolymer transport system component